MSLNTISPFLLAALFAPVDDVNLLLLTAIFEEPDPRPQFIELDSFWADILGRFINLDEPENGWAWQDESADASEHNFKQRLVRRICEWMKANLTEVDAEEKAYAMFDKGAQYIAYAIEHQEKWEAAQPAWREWMKRKAAHQLTAPRIAYANALAEAMGPSFFSPMLFAEESSVVLGAYKELKELARQINGTIV